MWEDLVTVGDNYSWIGDARLYRGQSELSPSFLLLRDCGCNVTLSSCLGILHSGTISQNKLFKLLFVFYHSNDKQ